MKEGWEYKKLGEVVDFSNDRISASLMNEDNYVGVDNLVLTKCLTLCELV